MVQNKNYKRKTRKVLREEWLRHVEKWKGSGSSKRTYCTKHGLSYQRFLFWSKDVQGEAAAPKLKLVKLTTSATPGEIEVASSCENKESYPFRVQFPKGYSIDLQNQFSASTLVRLVNTLESL